MSDEVKDLVIPTIDDLVEKRVDIVSRYQYLFKEHLARSGKMNRALRAAGEFSQGAAVASIGVSASIIITWLAFIFFDFWGSVPLPIASLFISQFLPIFIFTAITGGGFVALGKFLENKTTEKTLELAASEEEARLLENGNYYRELKSVAFNEIEEVFEEPLAPLAEMVGELEDELEQLSQSRREAHWLNAGPSKDEFLRKLNALEKQRNEELIRVRAEVARVLAKKKEFRGQIDLICAHADFIAIQQKRQQREDANVLGAEDERRQLMEDIKDQIEDLSIRAKIDAGEIFNVPQIEDKK